MSYWTIKAPNGELDHRFLSRARRFAIEHFQFSTLHEWKALQRKGYRCVRVTIQEVQR